MYLKRSTRWHRSLNGIREWWGKRPDKTIGFGRGHSSSVHCLLREPCPLLLQDGSPTDTNFDLGSRSKFCSSHISRTTSLPDRVDVFNVLCFVCLRRTLLSPRNTRGPTSWVSDVGLVSSVRLGGYSCSTTIFRPPSVCAVPLDSLSSFEVSVSGDPEGRGSGDRRGPTRTPFLLSSICGLSWLWVDQDIPPGILPGLLRFM